MNKPTDSVRIVIFDIADQSRFLALAEADDPTNWKLPGGKFDTIDETPESAAERELCEELGIAGSVIDMRKAGELTTDDGISARYIFVGTTDVDLPCPSAEIAAIRWITEAAIPDGPNKGHMASAVRLARTKLA